MEAAKVSWDRTGKFILKRKRFRFESGWADQVFSGVATLERHRTVNAATRRFESCSRSHAGLTQTGRVPLLQSGCPWFDPRTPHQVCRFRSSVAEQPTDNRPTKVRFFPGAPRTRGLADRASAF